MVTFQPHPLIQRTIVVTLRHGGSPLLTPRQRLPPSRSPLLTPHETANADNAAAFTQRALGRLVTDTPAEATKRGISMSMAGVEATK